MKMKENIRIGLLGEQIVLLELAKRGVQAINLPDCFDYDLLTTTDKRLEVKTAKLSKTYKNKNGKRYEYLTWLFNNHHRQVTGSKDGKQFFKLVRRNRRCDFFIFVCLNAFEEWERIYIVPKAVIGTTQIIRILKNSKNSKFNKYEGVWELLTK